MAGDYTRFTFKPQSDFSGVFKQQGRVDLDADFNELIEIIDRRWRSETIDIISHCVVPKTTPAAFLIAPSAMGDFDIGIGRMYVDGIQVENHGLPALEYQADLGETRGTGQVPYHDQPYLPAKLPPTLTAAPNTTDLVYIDVWQREVTVLEDPSIREIALGGPDTTTRIQSVWQVRVLTDVGRHGCGDSIAKWDQTIAPSAGRLSTSEVAPPASDDPCIISPSGGYRGLENRLYRVEIHSPGTIGGASPAKFKWSRNNSTVASTISAILSPTQVTVQLVGRDQVLRFEVGNWIEITDDFREFQSLAGHMAQITAIDEASRELTFTPPIPGTMNFDVTAASRHTRVRRWDQSQNVDANGFLDVNAGPIEIEVGVRVTFSFEPVGGGFKVGDYWVFAARTADGKVEPLKDAPPRGILHHFCRLGFIQWGADLESTTFTDCREHWPPEVPPVNGEACCTVIVRPGDDIQAAIDLLPEEGGCVCLKVGIHPLRSPITISRSNVCLHGESLGSVVRSTVPGTVLTVAGANKVVVATIRFELLPAEPPALPLVHFVRSQHSKLCDCTITMLQSAAGIGIQLTGCRDIEVCSNFVESVVNGVHVRGNLDLIRILNNTFVAPRLDGENFWGNTGIRLVEGSTRYRIENNVFRFFQTGVSTGGGTHSTILHNQIERSAIVRIEGPETKAYAVDAAGVGTCVIRDNLIDLVSSKHGGVRVLNVPTSWIEKNELRCRAPRNAEEAAVGIFVQRSSATICENVLELTQQAQASCDGIMLEGSSASMVSNNKILGYEFQEGNTGLLRAISANRSNFSAVCNNFVFGAFVGASFTEGRGNRLAGNEFFLGAHGITASSETGFAASQNSVLSCMRFGFLGAKLFDTASLIGNSFVSCGHTSAEVPMAAIACTGITGELRIEMCDILDTGISVADRPNTAPVHGISIQGAPLSQIIGNHVSYRSRIQPSEPILAFMRLDHRALFIATNFGNAQISDNRFAGLGRQLLIEANLGRELSRLIFSNNFCELIELDFTTAISIISAQNIVLGNNVRTQFRGNAITFNGVGASTVMGNMTTGGIIDFGAPPVPSPHTNFNVIV